jgi:anti-anti-sigma regulatory factor
MRVVLKEKLNLETVGEARQELLRGLSGSDGASEPGVTLDGAALTKVDVAGLQLLCSTSRFAAARGTTVVLEAGTGEAIARAARAAGFGPGLGCAASGLCVGMAPG